jgi:UDP-N-acetylmuramoyl-tripeptide--D-alanyl-D-alanine ligase
MEVTDRPDGVTVVNDAYNANPDSVQAALAALVELAGGRATWAVLGEMRELGEAHDAEHEAVGRLAAELGVDRLVVVGSGAAAVLQGARLGGSGVQEAVLVADVDAAVDLLVREVAAGDVVLVKASRRIGLERLAEALLATGGDDA